MGETESRPRQHEPLEPLIFSIRQHRVILDSDLARLYGTSTKALNQSMRRNASRFPSDFAFRLSRADMTILKSQIVTSRENRAINQSDTPMWSHFVTTSQKYRKLEPWAFTEHGALMAANVLRSERAVQMSIFVIRAFVRLREHAAANAAILRRLAEIDKTLLQHDAALRDVYRKLRTLLATPPETPKRRIGFQRPFLPLAFAFGFLETGR
jgi:hypothetical protein